MENLKWLHVLLIIGIIGIRVYNKTKVLKKKVFPLDGTDYIVLILSVIAIYLLSK